MGEIWWQEGRSDRGAFGQRVRREGITNDIYIVREQEGAAVAAQADMVSIIVSFFMNIVREQEGAAVAAHADRVSIIISFFMR